MLLYAFAEHSINSLIFLKYSIDLKLNKLYKHGKGDGRERGGKEVAQH